MRTLVRAAHSVRPVGAVALGVWLSLVWAVDLTAQETRPLTLEDYFRIESVGSPAISPDGRQVAFVRTRTLSGEDRRHSEIWLVPADGSGDPARLTSPAFSASNPEWSPDGRLLSFSSTRSVVGPEGEMRESYWFLRMDRPAGEAFRVEGVDGTPIFSPDDRWIAFTSATRPQVEPQADTRTEFEREIDERFDGRMYDWMNYRFDRRGYLPDPRDPSASPPRELHIVSREGGTPRQLTSLDVDVQGAVWRPDGGALAFTADAYQRDEYTYERADVWTVDLSGQTTQLTDDGYHYSSPAWSPNGELIVVRGYEGLDLVIEREQDHGSPIDLFVVPATGGTPRNITAEWDLMPGAPNWSRDGKYIYFTTGVGGDTHLFRVSADGGQVEQTTHGARRLRGVTVSADFESMAYQGNSPTQPGGDIFAARIDGSGERRLTTNNEALMAELSLSEPERITYASRDGTPIEAWIHYPNEYDPHREHPLILVIHGGPHGAYGNDFSFQRQLLAAQGYFVLYTNPRGSTGYGEDFKWAIWGGWGVLDYQDLMSGVDYVLGRYPIDPDRMGVTGGSYGGFMTNWVIGHTDRFAAAVARASISNWMSDYGVADIPRTKESEFFGPPWEKDSRDRMIRLSPITYAGAVTTPTLFLHGELDHRVPIEEAEQMYVALKKRRVPAVFIRYPDSYHGGWTPWRQVHALYHELKWWEKHLGHSRNHAAQARSGVR
ncbi:MAG: S9 family peptidase [Gemmatimonadota bacterium]|nr:MAG: S9 family peptidase [Gemmatimonadota bacterium]